MSYYQAERPILADGKSILFGAFMPKMALCLVCGFMTMLGLFSLNAGTSHSAVMLSSIVSKVTGAPQRNVLMGRRQAMASGLVTATLSLQPPKAAEARKEGLNQPQLLPPGPILNVVDKVNILTASQIKEANQIIDEVDQRFGVKLRVMTQKYPIAPGEAIADYWKPGAETVIVVVDDTFPNLLHFIVDRDFKIGPSYWRPGRFWNHLASDFGVLKYVRENGEDQALLNALRAIQKGLAEARG